MAEEFDPRWEYYVADPEVEYAVYCHSACSGFHRLDMPYDIEPKEVAFRFGRGNPDKCSGIVTDMPAPEYKETLEHVRCHYCREWYRPNSKVRKFCSRACHFAHRRTKKQALRQRYQRLTKAHYVRTTPRKEMGTVECARCKNVVPRYAAEQKYCSRLCASFAGAPAKPTEDKLQEVVRLYTLGKKVKEIAAALGVQPVTVKRWRRQAGIKPRPSGRPKGVR